MDPFWPPPPPSSRFLGLKAVLVRVDYYLNIFLIVFFYRNEKYCFDTQFVSPVQSFVRNMSKHFYPKWRIQRGRETVVRKSLRGRSISPTSQKRLCCTCVLGLHNFTHGNLLLEWLLVKIDGRINNDFLYLLPSSNSVYLKNK